MKNYELTNKKLSNREPPFLNLDKIMYISLYFRYGPEENILLKNKAICFLKLTRLKPGGTASK